MMILLLISCSILLFPSGENVAAEQTPWPLRMFHLFKDDSAVDHEMTSTDSGTKPVASQGGSCDTCTGSDDGPSSDSSTPGETIGEDSKADSLTVLAENPLSDTNDGSNTNEGNTSEVSNAGEPVSETQNTNADSIQQSPSVTGGETGANKSSSSGTGADVPLDPTKRDSGTLAETIDDGSEADSLTMLAENPLSDASDGSNTSEENISEVSDAGEPVSEIQNTNADSIQQSPSVTGGETGSNKSSSSGTGADVPLDPTKTDSGTLAETIDEGSEAGSITVLPENPSSDTSDGSNTSKENTSEVSDAGEKASETQNKIAESSQQSPSVSGVKTVLNETSSNGTGANVSVEPIKADSGTSAETNDEGSEEDSITMWAENPSSDTSDGTYTSEENISEGFDEEEQASETQKTNAKSSQQSPSDPKTNAGSSETSSSEVDKVNPETSENSSSDTKSTNTQENAAGEKPSGEDTITVNEKSSSSDVSGSNPDVPAEVLEA